MTSSDVLSPAILNYVSHNTYPDKEDIFSSRLTSDNLSTILTSLQAAQDEAKNDIRALSKSAAPDIDTWIARAKHLQSDIQRSRDTARQIVAEAEATNELKAQAEEQRRKAGLLEKEVAFNESLAGTLEHVRYASGLMERAQDAAVMGDVEKALASLENAESSILGLESLQDSRAVGVLKQRAEELRENLAETINEHWNACIAVNHDERSLRIRLQDHSLVGGKGNGFEHLVLAAQGLGNFDTLVQKLGKDVDRILLRPRMTVDDNLLVAKIAIQDDTITCTRTSDDRKTASLLDDLKNILNFLATHLPPSITIPLSSALLPNLTTRLGEKWLEPAIPLSMPEIPMFQAVLMDVSSLAELIEGHKWHGAQALRDWIENSPRTWLTKRREAVLGEVRNLVFAGLSERNVVERVETRVVAKQDPAVGKGGQGEEDWDTAWEEEAELDQAPRTSAGENSEDEDIEDASAWEMDADEDDKKADEEDDAWGWGDEEASEQQKRPASPSATRKAPSAPSKPNGDTTAQQEMTLRETFTVTAIPDGILAVVQQIVSDAESLSSDPAYSNSPIAPAAQALYTLPTLALAIYRATAPTAYSKLSVGSMSIYNDALRLADQLRAWQSARPPGSRLRLDNDVAALEVFAKKAYSSEMDSQRTILRDLLDGAQGFANSTQQPFKGEAESAVDGTVDRLRDVHRSWKDVLSQGALLQSLGSLLSTVISKMISEIEDLGDIGEAESKQLRILCDKVSAMKDLFTGGDGNDMTFVYSPTWLKFQYLAEILEGSLADIRWMWKEGELSLEFEAEEVVELVEALFAESELRRQAVRELRRGR